MPDEELGADALGADESGRDARGAAGRGASQEPARINTPESAYGDSDPREWGTPEGRRMVRLLWDPPPPATRGPRQRLSLDDIVSAAMLLAGRDGAEAVTMRRVAAELDVGVMSLYTYVPGRDELFELMIDRAWSIRHRADPAQPWRDQVDDIALAAWRMYQAHPWLVMTNQWRTPLGPHVLDAQEDLYRALSVSGLTPDQVARAASLVEGHVAAVARAAVVDTRLASATGVSADSYWDSRSSFWGTYYERARFPTMTSLWETGAFEQPLGTLDEMRFGLDLILDGLEALAGA